MQEKEKSSRQGQSQKVSRRTEVWVKKTPAACNNRGSRGAAPANLSLRSTLSNEVPALGLIDCTARAPADRRDAHTRPHTRRDERFALAALALFPRSMPGVLSSGRVLHGVCVKRCGLAGDVGQAGAGCCVPPVS